MSFDDFNEIYNYLYVNKIHNNYVYSFEKFVVKDKENNDSFVKE